MWRTPASREVPHHRIHLVLAGADAGEVGGGLQARFGGDAAHGVQRAVARGAARAIGDGDEAGMHRLELARWCARSFRRPRRFGREELEGDGDRRIRHRRRRSCGAVHLAVGGDEV